MRRLNKPRKIKGIRKMQSKYSIMKMPHYYFVLTFAVCLKRNDKEGRGSDKERELSVIMKELPSFNREMLPKNKEVSGVTNTATE